MKRKKIIVRTKIGAAIHFLLLSAIVLFLVIAYPNNIFFKTALFLTLLTSVLFFCCRKTVIHLERMEEGFITIDDYGLEIQEIRYKISKQYITLKDDVFCIRLPKTNRLLRTLKSLGILEKELE